MGLALRLTFHRAAEILGITTDDVRSLVVEMPRRLPAIYVTQVGYAEPYEWQLLRVDSAGNAFDMSVGGIDGAVHTGFLRIESAALEKFIRDNDLPARHETEFAPHPATEPGAPVPKPQAAAPAPVAGIATNNATPDPERRLARLRALGGDAIYRRGEWKITGISALVGSEKGEGRKRCDEKTIRADLKEAAESEREAKRANAFSGLGQR